MDAPAPAGFEYTPAADDPARLADRVELEGWLVADTIAADPGPRRAALVVKMLDAHAEAVRRRGTVDVVGLEDLARDVRRLALDADSVGSEREPDLVAEPAAAFLARATREPQWLVADLVIEGGITMFHGRPRSMKSLSALSLAVDASLGRPVFGRFAVARPLRVGYMTEEDGHVLVAARLYWLLAGQQADAPAGLWLSARKGLSLETPESQASIAELVRGAALDLAIFDTGRAFAPAIDKGPSEGAAAVHFLRFLLAESCLCGALVVHHDVKETRDGQDTRRRAERASGGALLPASDCPVGLERLSDREALAVPDAYKPSNDPRPFRIAFESATPQGEPFRDWLRVTAREEEEASAHDAGARDRVLRFVRAHPWSSTSDIDRGSNLRTGEAARILAQLEAGGLVAREVGDAVVARGRKHNAVLWRANP